MSAVDLAAGIGTGDGRGGASVRTCKAVGEESGELVGCIISIGEDFVAGGVTTA